MNRVFVGGISWGTDSAGLKDAFEQFGRVTDARIIVDKETDKSKGFGFVTYESDAGAELAIKEGDGMELDGRSLRVNWANQKQPAQRGDRRRR